MLGLTRFREREQGAIAMIVAMLFGFGVMIGLAALTVDVGNINADRRQLQNGADAVALAAAQVCAKTGTCVPTATNLTALANANAADGATAIKRVDNQLPLSAPVTTPVPYPAICGNATGLFQCQTTWTQSMSNLQECPSTPTSGVNYVRVYAETKNSAGNNILPYSFGAAIAGVGSGANQQACATVIYGPPSGAAAPITLSYCEWAAATGYKKGPPEVLGTYPLDPVGTAPGYGGGAPQPDWPTAAPQLPLPPVVGQEIIIQLQGLHATTCPSWNGHDVPGGFGYLSTSTSCATTATVGGWIRVDTGNTLPSSCASLLPYLNTVIYLPVFDCVATGTVSTPPAGTITSCASGNGANTWYRIEGYAKFFLSGYKVGGGPSQEAARTQSVTPQVPCSGSDRCLSGWFLKGLVDAPPAPPAPPGAPLLGAYSIRLSG